MIVKKYSKLPFILSTYIGRDFSVYLPIGVKKRDIFISGETLNTKKSNPSSESIFDSNSKLLNISKHYLHCVDSIVYLRFGLIHILCRAIFLDHQLSKDKLARK